MSLDEQQIADAAKHMEHVAAGDPENFAQAWQKEAQLLHANPAEMQKIREQIEADQKNDKSNSLPHIEFFNDGAVKSVDAMVKDPNDFSYYQGKVHGHVEFDKHTHNKRTVDTLSNDQNVSSHATFDKDGKPLQFDAKAKNGGAYQHKEYDPKTHVETLWTMESPIFGKVRVERDAKSGDYIKEDIDNNRQHIIMVYEKGKLHHVDNTDKKTGQKNHYEGNTLYKYLDFSR